MTPPRSAQARICSSSMFRGLSTTALGLEWLNTTGCSLVWGHPQGPTLTRSLIEGLEEAVSLGGGHVLLFGCAAGDVGIAAIFEVSDQNGGRTS